ncbi:GNAT family N-acetyltransferase [Chungangia koreensis]|uniref:GNAT family N-acetyltransferase n=1 Tax=Chungangia koreensis TaxID=752657 RepID=A0ABV8X795_9LACT
MIKELNLKDRDIVKQILCIQVPAYQVEAELIEFDGIPQLKDTIETIQQSGETFYGLFEDHALMGFVAVENLDDTLNICRLVVDPAHFRKGAATKLLTFILSKAKKPVTVSTGSKNIPAITLYKKHKFRICSEVEVAPGVFITQMFNPFP